MTMQSITYTITADGKIQIDVQGAAGGNCQELTKAVEEKLGVVENVEYKAEYYQQSGTTKTYQDHTVRNGNIYKSGW